MLRLYDISSVLSVLVIPIQGNRHKSPGNA